MAESNPTMSVTTLVINNNIDANAKGVHAAHLSWGVAVSPKDQSVYVSDSGKHRIRRITPDGNQTVIAGTGRQGYRDGAASSAEFDTPEQIFLGPDDEIYVAEYYNHRIRCIKNGLVTTVAGSGTSPHDAGFRDGKVDEALLCHPRGVFFDHSTKTIYIADNKNRALRRVENGVVSTVAAKYPPGNIDTINADFSDPNHLCGGKNGDVYMTDGAGFVWKISGESGLISLLSGKMEPPKDLGTSFTITFEYTVDPHRNFLDGPATEAKFSFPCGIAFDPVDDAVYVSDFNNNRIRKIKDGIVTTVAGTGNPGAADGPALQATFNGPAALWMDSDLGRLYIVDQRNNSVRVLQLR